ncbi:ABC transporter ATP-binding protein [Peptoniphilus raoultii]|uniref:ABC transporter ATP-binding protein n=1 Tax=Peptoniphilus raoultii TaxID=1776387 RepID=UPI0008DA0374|nr:ABC transporter ATP-binding protein [Peptoniphilus raoultii]
MKAIEIKNLYKDYKNFSLKNINLEIDKGTVMGLIGENGAGKTTIIKSILGLVNYKGSIKILGEDLSKEIKEGIGVVLNEGFFTETLKIKDIEKVLSSAYKNWDKNYFYDLIKEFKIPENTKYKEFSTGNKMKLKIAIALAPHPKFLILDEPTSGLDPVIRDEILDIFFDFIKNEDATILFSTHITSDLEKIADYITFISEGEIIFSKSKEELLYNYGILRTSEEEIKEYDPKFIIKRKNNTYNIDALIENKEEFLRIYPDALVDRPTIEEIMILFERGK